MNDELGRTRPEPEPLRQLVHQAFLDTHDGRSTDYVLADDTLNQRFLACCRERNPSIDPTTANWLLLNLRKAAKLGKVTTRRTHGSHDAYLPAAEIGARHCEDRFHQSLDRVLCTQDLRAEFDRVAREIAPTISMTWLRLAALGLRKARKLRPEVFKRLWPERRTHAYTAATLVDNADMLPVNPGIYIIRGQEGYLYVGEAQNLRQRVTQHLIHSDRMQLAHYLWQHGVDAIQVEIHDLGRAPEARRKEFRRAYEAELIRSRRPRFNIQHLPR